MSLFHFILFLTIFNCSFCVEEIKIGFIYFPVQARADLANKIFTEWISDFNNANNGIRITEVKPDATVGTTTAELYNTKVDKTIEFYKEKGVKVIFGFCFFINKVNNMEFEDYLKANNMYMFCASTKGRACNTNIVQIQDNSIYYSRMFLYFSSIYQNIIIIADESVKIVIENQIKPICKQQRCVVTSYLSTKPTSEIVNEILASSEDNFFIIINTTPANTLPILDGLSGLSGSKTYQTLAFSNLDKSSAAQPGASQSYILTTYNEIYESEEAEKMKQFLKNSTTDAEYETIFETIYFMYYYIILDILY